MKKFLIIWFFVVCAWVTLWGVELRPVLSIGSNLSHLVSVHTEYEFYQIISVAMDGAGNLYVLDFGKNCVVRFDRNGKFLGTFGEPGQGPEGFTHPEAVMFNPFNNHVYVLENFGFSLKEFRKSGRFVKKITLKHQFTMNQGIFLDESHLLLANPDLGGKMPYFTTLVVNLSTGKVVKLLDSSYGNPLLNARQGMYVNGATVQVFTGDRFEVRDYRLSDGKLLHRFPVEGEFQKSTVREVHRGAMRGFATWIYTSLQPLKYHGRQYVLVYTDPNSQGVEKGDPGWKTPYTDLYELVDGKFRKKMRLKGIDNMMLMFCDKNRLAFCGWEPDPFISVFQFHDEVKGEKLK